MAGNAPKTNDTLAYQTSAATLRVRLRVPELALDFFALLLVVVLVLAVLAVPVRFAELEALR